MSFPGFEPARTNYAQVPKSLFNNLHLLTTLSMTKTVFYVVRHTYPGWEDMDDTSIRKLTLDELVNGRKYKDGTRMDAGTGLSKPSVINGVDAAEQAGFILILRDHRDKARKRHYYRLRKEGEPLSSEEDVGEDGLSWQLSGHASPYEPPRKHTRAKRDEVWDALVIVCGWHKLEVLGKRQRDKLGTAVTEILTAYPDVNGEDMVAKWPLYWANDWRSKSGSATPFQVAENIGLALAYEGQDTGLASTPDREL
jgi:hypothetical protein